MIELYENLSQKDADLCALVLKASGISHRVKGQSGGWSVWVNERHYAAARHAMRQYFEENQAEPFSGPPAAAGVAAHGYAGIWMALFLGVVYMAVERAGTVRSVWVEFGASAERITSGELYRAVTALMLHADAAHLVGNMAGLALFGTAVCQVTGWGVGTLMVLLTGVTGNLINAFMYESAHLSIGASTAVFGAVGILSGYQFIGRRRTGQRRAAAWLPLAGGLALLGLLGSGAHVDLAAHFFGFISGIGAGVTYARADRKPAGAGMQKISLAAAASLMLVAWAWGVLLQQ